ncbi:TetR family transcriptional regulator C-terminal domain-containing protein [Paeniglutamicibacter sp. MACA_103]|uniref:TetR family transcriptional regulator C-terminal domain-containing protein n=1 Tax=Paeniglutamicibacter sp. MACA_103 TaxID=3377337 RepID=UPI00389529FE
MPEPENIPSGIAERIREAIRNTGLPQRKIARRTGFEESKLSKSLSGTRKFTSEEIVLLATVTGVTANWLITGSDAAQTPSAAPPADILPKRHREDEKHAQRRRSIIGRAWWLFSEQGYAAVRIADIAKDVGVSTPTVHYYFPSKQALFAETLHYSVKLAYDRQVAGLQPITDPVAQLKRLVELQLPLGAEGRAEWSIWLQTWTKLAVSEGGLDTHSPGYRRWTSTVHDIISAGQKTGHFVTVDAGTLTAELTAMFDGMGIQVLTGNLTPSQMFANICGFIDRTIIQQQGATS